MKKLLITMIALVGLVVAFSGCKKTPQKQAELLVKKRLEVSLHDFSSYESVQFGTLDSTFSQVKDLEEFQTSLSLAEKLKEKGFEKGEDAKLYSKFGLYQEQARYATEAMLLLDSAMFHIRRCEELDSLFTPEFIGWQITHSFRAKNASGNKIIAHRIFYFDKDLTRIVKDEDNSEK
ncbi:hypothetical protein HQ45_06790 [Porphyromonas crevioricanis]|uniref:Lipoprotein n=1 Tax=Porphyromonas crevioricanis JCM 15906 TaxID=1305617 RepID=S4NB73_9PORP|nr:hypothetical protein [Porphyromonas crevioricanis]KGN89688.1 hypothetical protein HQ45_06790 [Porphyromonas crevioricanis]GAD04515.1 hypothetical protein PORCRE_201 [Porphyromonas crevioricanis JCM 15906]SJZ77839.1 hypothetical protein SAMN02745203_00831 [Porphyromonas crevioricanis]